MEGCFYKTGTLCKDDVMMLHPYVYIQMLM